MPNYYPRQEAKLKDFLQNFVDTIDATTAEMKLPAGTFDPAKEAAQAWLDAYEKVEEARKKYEEAQTTFEKQAPLTNEAVRAACKQIKNTVNVPASIITALQLESSREAATEHVAALRPVLTLKVELGVVKGKYVKSGHQALDVYSCRTGEEQFTKLGRFTLNTFVDDRPLPPGATSEIRQYYGVFVDRDEHVGEQSATVAVPVGGRPG